MNKLYRPLCIILTIVVFAGCGSVPKTGSESAALVSAPSAVSPAASSAASSGTSSVIPSASVGLYAYECLNEKEKAVYDAMEYALVNHQDRIPVETLPEGGMRKVFFFVLKDHPEIFWCTSYTRHSRKYSDGTVETEFEPNYNMTKEERYDFKERIDKDVTSYLAAIPSGASDYEKAKILFDAIVTNVDYDEASDNNQNIVSVFVNHRSVCTGYARAYQYLLAKVGIESTLVEGTAKGGAHAWNLVKLDGDYYYFDVTWGDPSFTSNNNAGFFINYAYFGATEEDLLKTHVIDDEISLPECRAVKDNYFVHEGIIFGEKDPAIIGKAISNADGRGERFISLRFETEEVYKWAVDYFIKNQHVFEFYSSSRRFFMYNNDELFILSFIREKGD